MHNPPSLFFFLLLFIPISLLILSFLSYPPPSHDGANLHHPPPPPSIHHSFTPHWPAAFRRRTPVQETPLRPRKHGFSVVERRFDDVGIRRIEDRPLYQSWHVSIAQELQPRNTSDIIYMVSKVAVRADSQAGDKDDGLYDDVYQNLSNFRKSYQTMEKVFRIYVYKDGNKPLIHEGYRKGIYASEGLFIDTMEAGNQFTVQDPRQAHMFFMPYSVKQMVLFLHDPYTRSMKIMRRFIRHYVDMLASKYPFWNRTEGRDHFFVSCHDWALHTVEDHEQLRTNAVKVVCNADVAHGFEKEKDVSLPETYIHGHNLNASVLDLGGADATERPFLAFFAGQMHGDLRPKLLEMWKDRDPNMKIYEVLPAKVAEKLSYVHHMKRSKFCLCPRGFHVNSPRLVEAIYYDCVPVLISNNFVLPFSDVLDWNRFSVTIAEHDVHNLKDILTSIPEGTYIAMQRRLKYVRRHFLWHHKPVKYDIFHMIMHSLWTQRLRQLS